MARISPSQAYFLRRRKTRPGGLLAGGGDTPAPSDTTPNAFTFTDVSNATTSTVYTSNTITVSGINAPAAISITGGTYSKNGGSYVSTSGTVVNGDTVSVRHTSSASNSTATNTVLTIGGVSDTYTTTTAAPAVTNLFLSPDALDQSPWTNVGSGMTVVANQAVSPVTGLTTADKIYPGAAGGFHARRQDVALTSGVIYEWTVSAKADGQQWLLMYGDSSPLGFRAAWFDLVNGVTGSTAGGANLTRSITSLGGGWYKCTWRYTATSTASGRFSWANTNADNTYNTTVSGTNGLLLADSKLVTI